MLFSYISIETVFIGILHFENIILSKIHTSEVKAWDVSSGNFASIAHSKSSLPIASDDNGAAEETATRLVSTSTRRQVREVKHKGE